MIVITFIIIAVLTLILFIPDFVNSDLIIAGLQGGRHFLICFYEHGLI